MIGGESGLLEDREQRWTGNINVIDDWSKGAGVPMAPCEVWKAATWKPQLSGSKVIFLQVMVSEYLLPVGLCGRIRAHQNMIQLAHN